MGTCLIDLLHEMCREVEEVGVYGVCFLNLSNAYKIPALRIHYLTLSTQAVGFKRVLSLAVLLVNSKLVETISEKKQRNFNRLVDSLMVNKT